MANATEDFISNFNSLSGETIGARRKNFRVLLQKTQQSLKDGPQQIDVSLLQPKNFLEETFKVEALIYFRKVSDLIEILKNENPKHITKILNASSSFLEEAFENITGEQLVKEIFPRLSSITKIKLINKLALHLKDTRKAEEFFEAIRENYGLYLASKLTTGCSGDFIVKSIKANRIEITPGQLMVIIKKYPDLTEIIFEALHGCNSKIGIAEKYKNIFIYLMQQNDPLFSKLHEKYNPDFCLGRRSTKRFIRADKPNAIKDSRKIYKLLKSQQVAKSLEGDFKEFYFNLFPTSLSKCKEEYDNLLSLIEPGKWKKVNLLLETFQKTFDDELWNYPEFVTSTLIKMMSPDDREVWMQTHSRPAEISEEEWISFMKPEKSIPLLKERIALTSSIPSRTKIVACLVKTCKINNDKAALLAVCKYSATKHHNDHYTVRQKVLKTIMKCFNLTKLQEDVWVHINELIEFGIVNNEYFYLNDEFLKAYISYRLDENLPVIEQLKRWVKLKYYNLSLEKPKHQKHCLLLLSEIVGMGQDEDEMTSPYVGYLNTLASWNETHPKYQIALLPYTTAREHFKLFLKSGENSGSMEKTILEFLKSDLDDSEKLELLNDLFACDCWYTDGVVLIWLLKNRPTYILDSIDLITKSLLKGSLGKVSFVWLRFKNYFHLRIPQKMCEILVKILKLKPDDVEGQEALAPNELGIAVNALSYLMEADDFLNLISSYYPSKVTVDLQSPEGRWMCKLHKAIAVSVRNVMPPSLALGSVLQFSKGDYLGYVQQSLYSVSHNVAESKLLPFFSELSNRAVSVRKHAIYLSVKVSNNTQVYGILKKLMKHEKNSSIRKCLFKGAFNFFINNQDDNSWELLKENVRLLSVKDNEAFSVLIEWKRIPTSYIQPYIVFTWDILKNLPKLNDATEKKCEILDAITPNVIPMLPKEFCTEIIKNYLFKSTELNTFETKIHSFASKCIIYSKSELEQEEHLKLAFSILKDYVKSSWYDSKTCSLGRKSVFNFIKELCSAFLEKKHLAAEIFHKFVALWNTFLKVHQALEHYLYLQFTLIYLQCTTLLEIGKKLYELYDSLLKVYGPVVNDSFYETLKLFISYYLLSDDKTTAEINRYLLIQHILKNGDSANHLMLVILLLPDHVPKSPKNKVKYEVVIGSLIKEQDLSVQIYLHKHLLLSSVSED